MSSLTSRQTKAFNSFKEKAVVKFANKFKYYEKYYVNSATPIKIKCPIHGVFYQTPAEHLRSKFACAKCSGNYSYSTKEFISECVKVHADKYDYSKTKYTKATDFITVTCKRHGPFQIKAYLHKQGQGCRDCGYERNAENSTLTTKDFIKNYKKIHGSKNYSFDKTVYTKAHDAITVTCKKHGDFSFSAYRLANCPSCSKRNSREQNRLARSLRKYFKVEINKVINGIEYDIFIPEKNLAIEVNGVYWHSEQYRRHKSYHQNKTFNSTENGITLLHFWDYEINSSFKLVKSMILAKAGVFKKRKYARDFVVKEISIKQANGFIKLNHLQSDCRSNSVALALVKNKKIYAVMTFGKSRFNKNFTWELIRFCSKQNYQIVGAASRLLTNFKRRYKGKVISYANIRFSDGGLYSALGFNYAGFSAPSYIYAKGGIRVSRYATQKHKLHNLLDTFDPNKSEKQNMEDNNYYRVWDCGNYVFHLSG